MRILLFAEILRHKRKQSLKLYLQKRMKPSRRNLIRLSEAKTNLLYFILFWNFAKELKVKIENIVDTYTSICHKRENRVTKLAFHQFERNNWPRKQFLLFHDGSSNTSRCPKWYIHSHSVINCLPQCNTIPISLYLQYCPKQRSAVFPFFRKQQQFSRR